jgi:2'-5' RNA ligase
LPVGAYSFKILTIAAITVKKRLFIAIDISEEARSAARVYIEPLRNKFPSPPVKWEAPENLHLTLKFLGSTDNEFVDRVADLVRHSTNGIEPFEIDISGTGVFPSAKNPRILWLGVNEPSGTMKYLAELIDQECSALGFEKERRTFKPHLTIARIRDPRGAANLGREHTSRTFGPIKFTCNEIVLYESKLGRGGSVYSKLATARFGSA